MPLGKEPLLLLPGQLNDGELWRDQVSGLADIANCFVGDITRGDTLHDAALAVLEMAPPRFALAGFSLGGYVAQEISRIASHRVSRVALLGTSVYADTLERLAQRRALDCLAHTQGRFHGFGERLLAQYIDPSHLDDAELLGRIRGMTERLGAAVFLRQNRWERKDGLTLLGQLRVPVLVLCGANDRITPVAGHRAMAALVPGARCIVVPDSGHLAPMEAPDAVTHALRDWLNMPAPLPDQAT